jgi:hypothetical protein
VIVLPSAEMIKIHHGLRMDNYSGWIVPLGIGINNKLDNFEFTQLQQEVLVCYEV